MAQILHLIGSRIRSCSLSPTVDKRRNPSEIYVLEASFWSITTSLNSEATPTPMIQQVGSEVRSPSLDIAPITKPLTAHHHSGEPGIRSQGEHTIDLSSLSIKPNTGNASIHGRSNADAATIGIPSSRLLSGIFGRKHRIRSSYLSLYRPLKTKRERGILALGIILALAAGVPLPIVGVIFGKLINSFPPNNDQIRTLVGELLGVAVAYFCVTWGWSTCWGVVGERVSRGLREDLLRKVVGMDIAWFEVEALDVCFSFSF